MAEYYNAETLLEFVKQNTPHIDGETTMECVGRAIKEAPTADVVEVVRCKDCKYFTKGRIADSIECFCTHSLAMIGIDPDTYCSCGERRDT
jgi:hypothetical protein